MDAVTRRCLVLLALFLPVPVFALQVTLDSGVGSPLTIVDNDGNDLDAAAGAIEFQTTVDGVFSAEGRVEQSFGVIGRSVQISARTGSTVGAFINTDTIAHSFVVSVDSDVFAGPGTPLGWSVFYDGTADDATTPTQADVEIQPQNDVEASIEPGPTSLATVSAPITPAVPPAEQPASFGAGQRGVNNVDATQIHVVWRFDPGPGDEIRLPAADQGDGVIVTVFNQADKCFLTMNKDADKLVKSAGGSDVKCIKKQVHLGGGDATACVDDEPDLIGAGKAEDRLLKDFMAFCSTSGALPAFGVNLGMCCEGGVDDGDCCAAGPDCASPSGCPGGACTAGACISGVAEDEARAVAHDSFGGTIDVSADPATAKCQTNVLVAVTKLHTARWDTFIKCKKNVNSFATEDDFVAACLAPTQPDTFAKILKAELKLAATVQRRCLDAGVTGLSTVFPGACSSEADVDYAACLARRVACRFCLGAVVADDIVAPLDCDTFDGSPSSSCP